MTVIVDGGGWVRTVRRRPNRTADQVGAAAEKRAAKLAFDANARAKRVALWTTIVKGALLLAAELNGNPRARELIARAAEQMPERDANLLRGWLKNRDKITRPRGRDTRLKILAGTIVANSSPDVKDAIEENFQRVLAKYPAGTFIT